MSKHPVPQVEKFGKQQEPKTLGEGLVIDEQTNTLHLVDIDQMQYFVLDRKTGEEIEIHSFDKPVTSVNLTTNDNWVVLTIGANVHYYNRSSKVSKTIVSELQGAIERLNDCRAIEINGKVVLGWGGVDRSGKNQAQFGTVDANGTVTVLIDGGIGISNGFALRGNELFYIDSLHPNNVVQRFTVARDGSLTESEPLPIKLPKPTNPSIAPAVLDGLWIDKEGYAWIAVNAASCVIRVDLCSGKIKQTITVPTPEVTTVAIDSKGTMFVTTARERHGQATPPIEPNEYAGATYRVKIGSAGVQAVRFPAPPST